MMTLKRLVEYISAEPFRPFRINMVSGQTFDIRHPEMIAVGRTTVRVFTFWSEDEELSSQRQHELSILLIESIEPLEAASNHPQN
jgi:hypothetical protein